MHENKGNVLGSRAEIYDLFIWLPSSSSLGSSILGSKNFVHHFPLNYSNKKIINRATGSVLCSSSRDLSFVILCFKVN